MRPEETIDHPIRWAWHRIMRRYNEQAAAHGGSMSIGYVLLSIDPQGTPSTKLGPKMGMEARSLTRTLRKMEGEGLIKRVPDSNDGRMARVVLTTKGKHLRDISRTSVIKLNETIQRRVPVKELEVFHTVIDKINALLDNDELFK